MRVVPQPSPKTNALNAASSRRRRPRRLSVRPEASSTREASVKGSGFEPVRGRVEPDVLGAPELLREPEVLPDAEGLVVAELAAVWVTRQQAPESGATSNDDVAVVS